MAESDFVFAAEVDAATDFKANSGLKVGHLVSMKMGGKELKKDFSLLNPMNPNEKAKLCGVITLCKWNKTPGGIIMVQGRISGENQGVFQDAIDSKDTNAEIEIQMELFKYKKSEKVYFKNWSTDSALKNHLSTSEGESTIDDELATEYLQLDNHAFTLYLIASDTGLQHINLDYDTQIKKSLDYGQERG